MFSGDVYEISHCLQINIFGINSMQHIQLLAIFSQIAFDFTDYCVSVNFLGPKGVAFSSDLNFLSYLRFLLTF